MLDNTPKTLWATANKLRANMGAAEYKHLVLGLIFLKYVADTFAARRAAVQVCTALRLSPLALTLSLTLPFATQAQDNNLSKPFTTCMDKSGGVTQAMVECIAAETQWQDARLNKAYKTLMAHLTAERKKQLQAAQRAWLTFRDTNCGFYFDPDGGSLARVSANDCVMTMTANRASELENLGQ